MNTLLFTVVPQIASAVDSVADAIVKKARKASTWQTIRTGAKGYAEKKKLQQLESIERMLTAMNLGPKEDLHGHLVGRKPAGF